MNDYYVYIIHDSTGDPAYIGMGSRNRWRRIHGQRNAKINALISFGGTLPPVKVRENLTEAEAHELERALIAFHGRMDLGLGPLLNLCDGGKGVANLNPESNARRAEARRGFKHTAEACAKISAAHCGKPLSAEHRAKQSAALKGRPKAPFSDAHRAALSAAHRGKKPSAETLVKMSEAQIRRNANLRAGPQL